jgi:hypothetical protein
MAVELLQHLLLEGLQVAQMDTSLIENEPLVVLIFHWVQLSLLELLNELLKLLIFWIDIGKLSGPSGLDRAYGLSNHSELFLVSGCWSLLP